MQVEQFVVRNVKCNGCVNTIHKNLGAVAGVERVDVTLESGQVSVEGNDLSRDLLSTRLVELGYPLVN